MQAYFIQGFVSNQMLTPAYILTLFITSVLAFVWALDTTLRLGTTRRSALFVSFFDLCFIGAFIASIYELSGIANQSCSHFVRSPFMFTLGPFGVEGWVTDKPGAHEPNRNCNLLKTAFAFGIMNLAFFVFSMFFVHLVWHHDRHEARRALRRRSSRHSSRHRGGSKRRRSRSRSVV